MNTKKSSMSGDTGRRSSSGNNNDSSTATTKTAAMERKEIERNRRQHMKSLCEKLTSLIPKEHCSSSKDAMTQLSILDEATAYIKKLESRVDELQHKRNSAQLLDSKRGDGAGTSESAAPASSASGSEEAGAEEPAPAPVVEVWQNHDGSRLEVVLISSLRRPFKLHEVVTVLEEEGAEIINVNFSVDGRKMFYTIHCRAFSSRIGIEVSRVSERLRALV